MNVLGQLEALHQTLGNAPPSPWDLVLTLEDAGNGLSLSLKVGCKLASDRKEDATFVPSWVGGSWKMTPLDT